MRRFFAPIAAIYATYAITPYFSLLLLFIDTLAALIDDACSYALLS